jgi:hypothetical protein
MLAHSMLVRDFSYAKNRYHYQPAARSGTGKSTLSACWLAGPLAAHRVTGRVQPSGVLVLVHKSTLAFVCMCTLCVCVCFCVCMYVCVFSNNTIPVVTTGRN